MEDFSGLTESTCFFGGFQLKANKTEKLLLSGQTLDSENRYLVADRFKGTGSNHRQ